MEQPYSLWTKLFTSKPAPGLLTHLKIYLNDIAKTKDDILLVNPYAKNNAITKKLELETINKDKFYTDLLASVSANSCHPTLVEVHSTPSNVVVNENKTPMQASASLPSSTPQPSSYR